MTLHIEVRRHPGASVSPGQFTRSRKGGQDGRTHVDAVTLFTRELFHVHLAEDLREELHPVVVVHGHELVILAAGDLVGDLLAVDDSRHAVFHFFALILSGRSDRFNPDIPDTDLASVLSLPEPALAGFHAVERLAVDAADAAPLILLLLKRGLLHDQIEHVLGDDGLRMESALLLPDVLQRSRGERKSDRLAALQHLLRHLAFIITRDDSVDDIKPCGDRDLLEGPCGEGRQFILTQVIDQVTVYRCGFDGECSGALVHDDAVGGEHLVPLVLREIDVGGDHLRVRLRLLGGNWTGLDLVDDVPEFLQHILPPGLSSCLDRLASLIVETVSAVLQLAGLDASVGTVGNHRGPAVAEFPADAPQVESLLAAGCPAQHATPGPQIHERTHRPSVFSCTDTVAVKSHDNTAVCVAGMDVVLRQVEIFSDDSREGIVGFPVGRVRTPVLKRQKVLPGQGIGEKRGVMPLNGQQNVSSVLDEASLHAVAPERVLQLRCDAHVMAQCVRSR